ncbi:hypothetical protein [Sphingobacterium sp. LRF_L2]|uniref:hypothetical protein n=1 Tax=Sphingobacterium sp. LRF_L2 TaxID=3369421 RepID=UPI003F5F9E98
MENFLPVLLIVGGAIYKIYSEYKKEQEKARHRKPNIPPTPPVTTIPPPVMRETMKAKPAIPVVKKQSNTKVDLYPEEVARVREQKKTTKSQHKEVPSLELEVLKEQEMAFDLRQAIIQSAILERPYK